MLFCDVRPIYNNDKVLTPPYKVYLFDSKIQNVVGHNDPSVVNEIHVYEKQFYVYTCEFKAKILSNPQYNYKDCKRNAAILLSTFTPFKRYDSQRDNSFIIDLHSRWFHKTGITIQTFLLY